MNFGRNNRLNVISAGDVLRTATFQILKGLEFSNVFVCGVNNIDDRAAEDDATRHKLVYVALTRANGQPHPMRCQAADRLARHCYVLRRCDETKSANPPATTLKPTAI